MRDTNKVRLRNRLDSYWKLELLNAVLVPAAMIFFSFTAGYRLSIASYVTMVPMCGLLYVGGMYWRAKHKALDAGMPAVWTVMPLIHKLKRPLALLTILAIFIAIAVWLIPGWSASLGDQWTSTGAAVLAFLEYINYYHRQLQHFDHPADFKRLVTGRGFRRSQMARDLQRWRSKFL